MVPDKKKTVSQENPHNVKVERTRSPSYKLDQVGSSWIKLDISAEIGGEPGVTHPNQKGLRLSGT